MVTALPLLAALWGFSVDDAWIVARVVENGRRTGVFGWNQGAPRSDAVTPLGFAELLSVVCSLVATNDAFWSARLLGEACALLSLSVTAWVGLGPGRQFRAAGAGDSSPSALARHRRAVAEFGSLGGGGAGDARLSGYSARSAARPGSGAPDGRRAAGIGRLGRRRSGPQWPFVRSSWGSVWSRA